MTPETESLQSIGQSPLLPPREPLGARMAAVFGRHQAALLALCIVLLWVIVALPPLWRHESYQQGMAPGHDIFVPQQAFVMDGDETRRRQDDAANLVTPDYDPNPDAQSDALAHLTTLIETARTLSVSAPALPMAPLGAVPLKGGSTSTYSAADLALLQRWRMPFTQLNVPRSRLKDPVLLNMAHLDASRWGTIESAARLAVMAVYKKGQLRSDVLSEGSADLTQARNHIVDITSTARRTGRLLLNEASVASALAYAVVASRPNQVVNQRQTAVLREAARANVPPVFVKYKADDVLVRANEIITERKWEQMQELELVAPRLSTKVMLAHLGLIILLVFFGAAYLKSFLPHLVAQPAALWLTAMVPVAFAFAFRLLLRVSHAEYLMVPLVATAAMLLTVLINARVGVIVGFMLSCICSMMAHTDATWLLAATLASCIGSIFVSDLASLMHVVRAGVVLSATNAILFAIIGVMGNMDDSDIALIVIWEAVAGVGSVVVMSGLALFLERPFGITTHFRLMELLSPNETVMRRMQAEAPGTYTHSLMVAMLAEAGAKAVGADPLLCRVGALYHDIGKLRRPHCFIENQSGHNIHDDLSPQLSALIILAHVKDGLELGRALRLPQPVMEIIAQHHGTTVLSYFYNRALQGARSVPIPAGDVDTGVEAGAIEATAPGAPPDIALFRYAGPRPQSKEAALVLLADSIEASSRSLPDLTPEKLRAHIQKMVSTRLQEGELSECELTLRDLGTIEEIFTHILRGVLHQRILYPNQKRDLESNGDWVHENLGTRRDAGTKPAQDAAHEAAERVRQRRERKKENRKEKRRARNASNGANNSTDTASTTMNVMVDPAAKIIESGTSSEDPHEPRNQSELGTPAKTSPNGTSNRNGATSQNGTTAQNGAYASETANPQPQSQLESGRALRDGEPESPHGHPPGNYPGLAPGDHGDVASRPTASSRPARRL